MGVVMSGVLGGRNKLAFSLISRNGRMSSTAESSPRLPAELQFMVVDHLHDDRKTLTTCALVCQAWLSATRHHLFGSINIQGDFVSRFAALVEDTPSLREHVRDLTVSGPGLVDGRALVRIIIPLRNLEALSFAHFALLGAYDTQLTDDLLAAIWSLEYLRRLHLDASHYGPRSAALHAPVDVTGLALLESLDVFFIKHDVTHQLWRAIALAKQSPRKRDVRPLTRLKASLEDYQSNYAESLSAFNSFLQVVGHGLKILTLAIDTRETSFLEQFSKSSCFHARYLTQSYLPKGTMPMPLCVNLHHLQLHFFVRATSNSSLDAACVLVSLIPHTAPLSQITLEVGTSVVYDDEFHHLGYLQSLRTLDQILYGLPHLKALTLRSVFTGRNSIRAKVEVEWLGGHLNSLKSKKGVTVNSIV